MLQETGAEFSGATLAPKAGSKVGDQKDAPTPKYTVRFVFLGFEGPACWGIVFFGFPLWGKWFVR